MSFIVGFKVKKLTGFDTIKKINTIIYALSIGTLISGLRILLMWSGGSSKLLGLIMVCISLFAMYCVYFANRKNEILASRANTKYITLGLFLIAIDVAYNLYTKDALRSFDYGMIIAGLTIIILNTNFIRLLKLNDGMVSFASLFIFFTMSLMAFFSKGILLLTKLLTGESTNFIYDLMTDLSLRSSFFILGLIKPSSVIENVINFGGFSVGVAYPCSGVETMVIFLSSIASYFISTKEQNIKKIAAYTILGSIMFYFVNVVRIVVIILVGYYYGSDALKFTHYNLGWILLTIGMMVFWYFLLNDKDKGVKNQ